MNLTFSFILILIKGISSKLISHHHQWDQESCPTMCKCKMQFWEELKVDARTVFCINESQIQIPSNLSSEAEAVVLSHNTLGLNYHLNLLDLLHLRKLSILDLSFNRLRSLRNTGGTIDSVSYLNLSYNLLPRLEHAMFRNFPEVRVLNLRSNNIVFIVPLALELSKLEILDISYNKLTALQSSYFSGLRSLRTLLLKKNNIGKIYDPIVHHLGQLSVLDLSMNKINKLEPEAFTYIGSILKLDLSNNHFTRVPREALSQLSFIRSLNLDRNYFKVLHTNSFIGINVSDISLSYNANLLLIEKHAFVNISICNISIVDNRKLMFIENSAFFNLKSLKRINLKNNGLLTLNRNIFNNLPFLKELILSGNPFWCSCSLKWLQINLKRNSSDPRIFEEANVLCEDKGGVSHRIKFLGNLPNACRPKILPLFPNHIEKLPANNFSARCFSDGIPPPKIKWLKKNQMHEIGCVNRSCVEGHHLTIRYVHQEDKGVYMCSASNDLGNDSRSIELEIRDLNIQMFPVAITSTFVALSWNRTSGASSEYMLQYQSLRSDKVRSKTISMGLKGHSYTLSGLQPGETYEIWLCIQKEDVVIRLSSILITTRDEGFLVMLGIETNYFSIGVVAVVVSGICATCCLICSLRLCRWRIRKHKEMVLADSASQRCFSNSSSASSALAFMTFVNVADEAALVENDDESYE